MANQPIATLPDSQDVAGNWIGVEIASTYGGTGVDSPVIHGLMIGQGSSPMNSLVLQSGQVPYGVTGSDPTTAYLPTTFDVAVSWVDLFNGSSKILLSSTGAQQYRVLGMTINMSTDIFSGSSIKSIIITDGFKFYGRLPSNYITGSVSGISQIDPYSWGDSSGQFPYLNENIGMPSLPTSAGANLTMRYDSEVGGYYTGGSFTITLTTLRVA